MRGKQKTPFIDTDTYSYLKNKLLLLSSNIEKIKKLFILTYSLSAIGCSGE